MKKILIITSNIYTDSDANGVCTRNLVRELITRGYEVFCISEPARPQDAYRAPAGLTIVDVERPWYQTFRDRKDHGFLFKAVSLLRYGWTMFLYPDVYPRRTKEIAKAAAALIEGEGVDLVLGLYRPYEAVAALLRLKVTYGPRLRCVSYHLDLLLSPNNGRLIRGYKVARGRRAFQQELEALDRVLLPETDGPRIPDEKVRYVGFPLYEKKQIVPCELDFRDDLIHIAYVGSLDGENRDPSFFLQTLGRIDELRGRVRVHFWGGITDAVRETLGRYADLAEYHGVIANEHVSYLYQRSDFLLNVSNRNTPDMIPSKIYQMFASGRPILNCVADPGDKAKAIVDRYPLSFTLYEYRDNDLGALRAFLTSPHEPPALGEDAFAASTPGYVADRIVEP